MPSAFAARRGKAKWKGIAMGFLAGCLVGGVLPAAAQESSETAPPPSGFQPRIVREGTLSLGAQAGYGSFIVSNGFGRDFNTGLDLAVRVRYRTSRDQALGVSFEAQRYDAKKDPADPFDPKWLQCVTTTVEYYQYFNVRKRAPQYLLAGAGLLQTHEELNDGETDFPGDGGVITAGGGTEYWWKRVVSIDLSLRYYAMIRNHEHLAHAVQVAGGFHFYTSK